MIGIDPKYEVVKDGVRREYENDDPLEEDISFYTEKETGFIYEVRLFPDFALVRLAMPDYQSSIQRIDLMTFAAVFDEYVGNSQELRAALFGGTSTPLIVSKKHGRDE